MKKLLLAVLLAVTTMGHASAKEMRSYTELAKKTDGLELIIEVTDVNDDADAPADAIGYRYRVKSDKPNKRYRLCQYLINRRKVFDEVVEVRDGYLHDRDGAALVDIMVNCMEGESFNFYLISMDGKKCAQTLATPYPIQKSVGELGLTASLLHPSARAFLVKGRGFQPGEQVEVQVGGVGHSRSNFQAADGDGCIGLMPLVEKPAKGGTIEIICISASGTIDMTWYWGADYFSHAKVHGKMGTMA